MRSSPLGLAGSALICWLPFVLCASCGSQGTNDDGWLDANTGPIATPDAQTDAGTSLDAASGSGSDAAASDGGGSMDATLDAGTIDASIDAAADAALDAARSDGGMDAAWTDGSWPDEVPADGGVDAASDAARVDGSAADAGSDAGSDAGPDAALDAGPDAAPQAYAVGTTRIELSFDAGDGGRTIPVQLWYPAVEAARAEATAGHPTAEFEPAGARRTQLTTMLANSPDACTNKTMHAAHAPNVLSQSQAFPALVFSHCQDCVRFSMFTVAEHLAGLGFVVAAPDHVQGTIYDGTGILDNEFLETRAYDARKVIDALLDAQSTKLPAGLRGKIDADRIGMFGHSYGSVTTGRVLRDDPRVKAGTMIAAPIDLGSPLDAILPGAADVTQLKQPAMFFEGAEDNLLFTIFIDDNFERYPKPAWLVQIKDAGHWSFTDIAGFNGTFEDGCGTGTRQANILETFTYVDIVKARNITKAYVAAFFQAQLRNDSMAKTYLNSATPADLVTLKHHP